MEKTVRLSAEQRDDLVAYLDGELPEEKIQEIDQIVARSEVARHEVEALARTFELLDVLPTVRVSDDFTTKTLASIKVMERPYSVTDQWWYPPIVKTAKIGVWVACLVLCGWIGFQITNRWIPNQTDEILEDLPVIENLHQYREIGDVEFLKQLKQSGLFDEPQEK